MQSAVWPAEQEYLRTLHVMHAFVGLSLTAKFISDRTPRSIERLRSLSIPRWLVIFVLIDTSVSPPLSELDRLLTPLRNSKMGILFRLGEFGFGCGDFVE